MAYDIDLDIKMDTRLGLIAAHTWIEARVWKGEDLVSQEAIGLTNGGARGTGAMKRNLVAGWEDLNRKYSYVTTLVLQADQNLFTKERMMEMGKITVTIMQRRGTYWLFNNNCRAFVDIFLTLLLGQRDMCNRCLGIIATDNTSLIYSGNYILEPPYYFYYAGWTDHAYKVCQAQGTHEVNAGSVTRQVLKSNFMVYTDDMIERMAKAYQK